MAKHDLVIRGGSVIDGTGSPQVQADVACSDGVITHVGNVDGSARAEVDATDLLVTPGFVDIHTHYDGQATWDNYLAPSSWHGVTTVVMSNCGVGFAPVHDRDHDRLIELMEGVEDIPGSALHEGLSWRWNSVPEYLDEVDSRHYDIDLAAQAPHGALRLHVMGERGAARETATPGDIAEMGRLAAEAVEAGALGFTTSRTRNHRSSKGELTPTLTANVDELVGIAEALGALGQGVLQVVSDFRDVDAEFAILRQMVERSGRPLSLSLLEHPIEPGQWQRLLELITEANESGSPMLGQCAPRPIGIVMGLELTLHPFKTSSVFAEVADLGLDQRVAALQDAEFRSRLIASASDPANQSRLLNDHHRMYELTDPPNYEPGPDSCLAARAQAESTTPQDLALDILLRDGGTGMLFVPFANYVQGNLDSTRTMLTHPHTVVGLADGGAHVGTICDGSFPTTLLAHWGRDREHGRIELEFLVHRQCQATAAAVGLHDRGVLAPGYRGDINVIDFDRLQAHRPEISWDLPAGGRRLMQRASGYRHTFVAGVETYRDGQATGALPGRLVRGAQPTPVVAL